jgi:hypothetical protein
MVKRRLHLEVRIMYSSPYPHSGGASSIGRGRVELCAQRIPRDPAGFVLVSFVSGLSLSIYGCHL